MKTIANIPPLNHDWSKPAYEWSDDYCKVTASRVCARDTSHVETEDATTNFKVTKPATCEEKGETTYTSAAFGNAAFTSQTKTVANIPALTHVWSKPVYEWAVDYSKVTASRVCAHDAKHIETETAGADRELVTAPTETDPGVYQIVSREFDNPAFAIQVKADLVIPALQDMNVLILPASLKTIAAEAFAGIAAEAFLIPEGCTAVEPDAFTNCPDLLYVRIPAGVVIPAEAFDGCSNVVIDRR